MTPREPTQGLITTLVDDSVIYGEFAINLQTLRLSRKKVIKKMDMIVSHQVMHTFQVMTGTVK